MGSAHQPRKPRRDEQDQARGGGGQLSCAETIIVTLLFGGVMIGIATFLAAFAPIVFEFVLSRWDC